MGVFFEVVEVVVLFDKVGIWVVLVGIICIMFCVGDYYVGFGNDFGFEDFIVFVLVGVCD